MHRVHDDGDARTRSSEAPQDSSFAAVGMDDIRATVAKEGFETSQSQVILQRMDRANQVRLRSQQAR
jgi:hypothetical protein